MNRYWKQRVVVFCLLLGIASFCSHALAEKVEVQIAEVKNNCKAIVTVISDDGVFETGCELNELARKHDLRMTVAGYVRNVRNHLAEWQAIVDEGYIELVSHSWNHQKMSDETNISDDQYYTEVYEAKLFYESNFGYPQIGFVCLIM
ncbi:MAG: polysaccharide deacetylase family protein [Oscillospiraceae bacterium]|nr:polysaccharide deacetylase family protein [Clostridia bacterium]MBQ9167415.1 polysaccharide deacetylase family protein [Oscillospiraceae bacterium]